MGFQKGFNLLLHLQYIGIGRLLQICQLVSIQRFHNTINVALQFLVIHTVELREFIADYALAVGHADIGRLLIEPLLEKGAVGLGQFPGLGHSFSGIIHIHPGHFCLQGGEINLNILILQGKALAQMLLTQQDILLITKQTCTNFHHELGETQSCCFLPEFIIHSEYIHFTAHLRRSGIDRRFLRVGDFILVFFVLLQGIPKHIVHCCTGFLFGVLCGCRDSDSSLQSIHIKCREILFFLRDYRCRRLNDQLLARFRFGKYRSLRLHILCSAVLAAEACVVQSSHDFVQGLIEVGGAGNNVGQIQHIVGILPGIRQTQNTA